MTVLIVYASVEGQSRKISAFIKTQVLKAGHKATLVDASGKMAEVTFEGFDPVILVAPVHERRHPPNFELLLKANQGELAARRTLMISVSLGAAFSDLMEEAQDYLDEMKLRTDLEPDAEYLAAGAIRPSSYGYYETQVLRHAILRDQPIDPANQEREFTDWDAISTVVTRFLAT